MARNWLICLSVFLRPNISCKIIIFVLKNKWPGHFGGVSLKVMGHHHELWWPNIIQDQEDLDVTQGSWSENLQFLEIIFDYLISYFILLSPNFPLPSSDPLAI